MKKKLYHIEKVTLIRRTDDKEKDFSFLADDTVTDLELYRNHLKQKYGVSRIHLNYEEVPEINNQVIKN